MAKQIQAIIADTVAKSKKLFDKGDILEAPDPHRCNDFNDH